MSLPIKDQIVIVSGAGRGLGASIAAAFAREGAKVAINYRSSRAQAEALAAELGDRARAFQADIRSLAETERLVADVTAHFGAPTTVVHNALADFSFNGDARSKLDALSWTEMSTQLETALQGALNLIQAARPAMAAAGFGRIVTIGTNLFQNPVVPYHDYTAAKAALLSLTRTAAAELGPLGLPSTWFRAACCGPRMPAAPRRRPFSILSPRIRRCVVSPRRRKPPMRFSSSQAPGRAP